MEERARLFSVIIPYFIVYISSSSLVCRILSFILFLLLRKQRAVDFASSLKPTVAASAKRSRASCEIGHGPSGTCFLASEAARNRRDTWKLYFVTGLMVGDRRFSGATTLGSEFFYLFRQPSRVGPADWFRTSRCLAVWTVYDMAGTDGAVSWTNGFCTTLRQSWWPLSRQRHVRTGPVVKASLSLSVAAAAIRVCLDVAASITSVLTLPTHLCGMRCRPRDGDTSANERNTMAPTMISTMAPKMKPLSRYAVDMSPTSEKSSGDTIGFMMRVHLRRVAMMMMALM